MRAWFHRIISKVLGRNLSSAPKELIIEQLNESRPLPMGRQEFMHWSDRLIAGAMVGADHQSQRYVLANMLMHLGPTESHKPDAHFIHSLRKFAVNQVADTIRREIHDERKAREEPAGENVVVQ